MTSIGKKPYILCDFRGGGRGVRTPCPPLDPHMLSSKRIIKVQARLRGCAACWSAHLLFANNKVRVFFYRRETQLGTDEKHIASDLPHLCA